MACWTLVLIALVKPVYNTPTLDLDESTLAIKQTLGLVYPTTTVLVTNHQKSTLTEMRIEFPSSILTTKNSINDIKNLVSNWETREEWDGNTEATEYITTQISNINEIIGYLETELDQFYGLFSTVTNTDPITVENDKCHHAEQNLNILDAEKLKKRLEFQIHTLGTLDKNQLTGEAPNSPKRYAYATVRLGNMRLISVILESIQNFVGYKRIQLRRGLEHVLAVLHEDLALIKTAGLQNQQCPIRANHMTAVVKHCKLFKNSATLGTSCLVFLEALATTKHFKKLTPISYDGFMVDLEEQELLIDPNGNIIRIDECVSFNTKESFLSTIRQNEIVLDCRKMEVADHDCLHSANRSAHVLLQNCKFKTPPEDPSPLLLENGLLLPFQKTALVNVLKSGTNYKLRNGPFILQAPDPIIIKNTMNEGTNTIFTPFSDYKLETSRFNDEELQKFKEKAKLTMSEKTPLIKEQDYNTIFKVSAAIQYFLLLLLIIWLGNRKLKKFKKTRSKRKKNNIEESERTSPQENINLIKTIIRKT